MYLSHSSILKGRNRCRRRWNASDISALAKIFIQTALKVCSLHPQNRNTPSHRAWKLTTRCTHDTLLYSGALSNTHAVALATANSFQLGLLVIPWTDFFFSHLLFLSFWKSNYIMALIRKTNLIGDPVACFFFSFKVKNAVSICAPLQLRKGI